VLQLNHIIPLPLEFVPWPTAALMGTKVMCPLIKLQSYDESGSLDMFLMKFHCMPDNVQ